MFRFAVIAPLLRGQTCRQVLSRHHTAAAAVKAAAGRAGVEAVCLDEEGDVSCTVQEMQGLPDAPGMS